MKARTETVWFAPRQTVQEHCAALVLRDQAIECHVGATREKVAAEGDAS